MLFEAVDALLDGGLGGAGGLCYFEEWVAVDVEEEEFAVVVILKTVDDAVEGLVAAVGGLVGNDVVDVDVEHHEVGHPPALAILSDGDIESYAHDPRVLGTAASKSGPRLTEVAHDFLIQVVEVVGTLPSEKQAHPHQDGLVPTKHPEKFCLLFRI